MEGKNGYQFAALFLLCHAQNDDRKFCFIRKSLKLMIFAMRALVKLKQMRLRIDIYFII